MPETKTVKLTIRDAARLLGESESQVRYRIKTQTLPAQKLGHRWMIRRDDLPLSEGQMKARLQKLDQVVETTRKVFDINAGQGKKAYSVLQLRAFERGREIYNQLKHGDGEHEAIAVLSESLVRITCGCHAFHPGRKAAYFTEAREMACRAVALLLLDIEDRLQLVNRLENEFLPAIGGLIRSCERKRKP